MLLVIMLNLQVFHLTSLEILLVTLLVHLDLRGKQNGMELRLILLMIAIHLIDSSTVYHRLVGLIWIQEQYYLLEIMLIVGTILLKL